MRYIYPPRAENKISPKSLPTFDKMGKFLSEPKLNGSSMQVYMDGVHTKTTNRHKSDITCKISLDELASIYKGKGEMVLCGEYMNKNQKDETGEYWNIKYVIWDIIVYNGEHLLGMTFEERYQLLRKLYPDNPVKKYMHQITENCFRIDAIYSDFLKIFDDISQYDMYEGLILKRMDGKLENGTSENNNIRTQIKARKGTKNYHF